jgi:hypothetical protein
MCAAYLGASVGLAAAVVYLPMAGDAEAIVSGGNRVEVATFMTMFFLPPLIAVGVVVTIVYLFFRRPFVRYAWLIVLFVVLTGDLTLLMADGWQTRLLTCWHCESQFMLFGGILPGTLFMLIPALAGLSQAPPRV